MIFRNWHPLIRYPVWVQATPTLKWLFGAILAYHLLRNFFSFISSSVFIFYVYFLLYWFMTLRASEAAAQCIVVAPVCVFVCLFVCGSAFATASAQCLRRLWALFHFVCHVYMCLCISCTLWSVKNVPVSFCQLWQIITDFNKFLHSATENKLVTKCSHLLTYYFNSVSIITS